MTFSNFKMKLFKSEQEATRWAKKATIDVPLDCKAMCAQIVKHGSKYTIQVDVFTDTLSKSVSPQVRYRPVEDAWKYPFKLLPPATLEDLLPLKCAPLNGRSDTLPKTIHSLKAAYKPVFIYSRVLPSLEGGTCMTHLVLSNSVAPCEFMLDDQLVRIRPAYPRLVEFLKM